jgi:hypothetical protein
VPNLEGCAIFRENVTPHIPGERLYDGWLEDMRAVGLISTDLCHHCIWSNHRPTPIKAARRLAAAGLLLLEDSPSGPMVTRTWRGSNALSNIG